MAFAMKNDTSMEEGKSIALLMNQIVPVFVLIPGILGNILSDITFPYFS